MSSQSEPLNVAKKFHSALKLCDKCNSYDDLCRVFESECKPLLEKCVYSPLSTPVKEHVSPDASCPDTALLRQEMMDLASSDDVWFFFLRAASAILNQRGKKRLRDGGSPDDVVVHLFVLFHGYRIPTSNKMSIRWSMLQSEKKKVEASHAFIHANASERRKMHMSSVLSVFSEKAHRHYFSALWTGCFAASSVPPALHLHLLYRLSTDVLPFLTHPLVVADYLSGCFGSGGLVSVLALQGVFILMLDHGLEYPEYYEQLYSLITADAFTSRHRYDLFRLVDVSLTSLRVPSYIAAAFAKRIARVAMYAPSPCLYFVLPILRKIVQRHPNCLALVHRTSAALPVANTVSAEEQDASIEGEEENHNSAAQVARLFDGVDPFLPYATLKKCNAVNSTLWELTFLEKHILPAVPLMVSAFSSAAEDNAPVKFEKTYTRLFTAEVTRSISDRHMPTMTYIPPSLSKHDLVAL